MAQEQTPGISIDPQAYAARLSEAYQEQLLQAIDSRAKFAAVVDMLGKQVEELREERDRAVEELSRLRASDE